MGFGDRLGKILSGFGGGLLSTAQAPFGLIKDIHTTLVDDGEDADIGSLLGTSVPGRFGQGLRGVLGPESGIGATVGGLPEVVRAPVRTVGDFAEDAYREVVSQPLSTAFTAGSLSESSIYKGQEGIQGGELGALRALFRARTWQDAYAIAEHRSPGQSATLMYGRKDVMDAAEVEAFTRTEAFHIISGTLDAVSNIALDPTALAAAGTTKARKALIVKPISGMTDLEKAAALRRVEKFAERVEQRTAGLSPERATAVIRHEFFPNHTAGESLSALLADAPTVQDKIRVVRAAAGDMDEWERLREESAAVSNRIARAQGMRESLAILEGRGFELPESVRKDAARDLAREVDELYDEQDRLARRDAAFGVLREVPRASLGGSIRATVTRSEVYQSSRFAAPLRVVFNMRPHHLVNLEEPGGDIQVARLLRESRLDLAEQERIRGEYARAVDPSQRQAVLMRAEAAAVKSIADEAGITPETLQGLMQQADVNRQASVQVLKSRAHDGEGRSIVRLRDDGPPVDLPLLVSQTANVLPIVDMDAVRRAASRIGAFERRFPGAKAPGELLEAFHRVWKPAVLLRPAWPMKVILDEQLRVMSQIGALGLLGNIGRGTTSQLANRVGIAERYREKAAALGRLLTRAERKRVREDFFEQESFSRQGFETRGYEIEPAFGPRGGEANVYKRLVDSRAAFDRFFGRKTDEFEEGLRSQLEGSGQFQSLKPTDPGYAEAWVHDVNRQLGQDALARRLMQSLDVDDAVRWLTSTPEGQRYARRVPYRKDYRGWANAVLDQINSYLPTNALREAALARKATVKMLTDAVPDATQRPIIHGEMLAQTLERGVVSKTVRKVVDGAYDALGRLPTNTLSRQPFFDNVYQAEVKRLVGVLDEQRPGGLTQADIAKVEENARRFALRETRALLYDLAEQSELSHMLRFISPFFSAWQEVGTVWLGIAVENPAFVRRLTIAWQAPEQAGLVTTDENGNDYVSFSIPPGLRNLPFIGKTIEAQGNFKFARDAANTMMGGAPGVGPAVQVPTYLAFKERPDVLSTTVVADHIFPFGQPTGLGDLLMPATAKRAISLARKEEDRAWLTSYGQIMATETVNWRLGKRETKPTHEEVRNKTNDFYKLRVFVSFGSPVGGTFESPYQLQIEAYRNLLTQHDPQTAQAMFLDQFGEEYFALTASVSKSRDGVPPTLEAWKIRQANAGLVNELEDPSLASLIVGAEGAGEFNRSVYNYQLATEVQPGEFVNQRERLSPAEMARQPDISLGWIKYRKVMDALRAELEARGLQSFQAQAASDLADFRKQAVSELQRLHPAWYDDYAQTDRAFWERRLRDMRTVVDSPGMDGRPDIAGLREYLRIRDIVTGELTARDRAGGAKTLESPQNADLRLLFDAAVERLTLENLAFSDLYDRFLANDQVGAA